MQAEGQTGKRTLSYRAWAAMDNILKNDPSHLVSKKVQEIKDITGAVVVNIVIITNSKYYIKNTNDNSSIIVITNNNNKYNHLELHNKIIFDENSTKCEGYTGTYPNNHPWAGGDLRTLLMMNPTIEIYPRKGYAKDKFGVWVEVGDEDHNVLDPEHGWKLHYLYNKGLLEF